MTLQEKMIQYRAKENISQEELARRCRLSKQTIYAVENGIQEPGKLTKEKIKLIVEEER